MPVDLKTQCPGMAFCRVVAGDLAVRDAPRDRRLAFGGLGFAVACFLRPAQMQGSWIVDFYGLKSFTLPPMLVALPWGRFSSMAPLLARA